MVDGRKAKYWTTRKGGSGTGRIAPEEPYGLRKTSPVRAQTVGLVIPFFMV